MAVAVMVDRNFEVEETYELGRTWRTDHGTLVVYDGADTGIAEYAKGTWYRVRLAEEDEDD